MEYNRELEVELEKEYPSGTRVKLIKMDDLQAPPEGTFGTVENIDDAATIHARWDNGSSLGLIYGEDELELA